jgi:flavorubredoxin
MKALVVCDSVYGNTEKVALAIGEALKKDENEAAIQSSFSGFMVGNFGYAGGALAKRLKRKGGY